MIWILVGAALLAVLLLFARIVAICASRSSFVAGVVEEDGGCTETLSGTRN